MVTTDQFFNNRLENQDDFSGKTGLFMSSYLDHRHTSKLLLSCHKYVFVLMMS